MGQYYRAICLLAITPAINLQHVSSSDYGNGPKLMEHSYLTNGYLDTVESLLAPGGAWHKKPLVWAGDYADDETDANGNDLGHNLYDLCYDESDKGRVPNKLQPAEPKSMKRFRYIVNHTTKQYVDKRKVPANDTGEWKGKPWTNYIHPLSILTCEGNGRGGGDLHLEHPLIGSWARNVISVETSKPKGYTELAFNLTERGPVEQAQLTAETA